MQVQFNDAGSFGGADTLTWDKTSSQLTHGVTGDNAGFDPAIRAFYDWNGQVNIGRTHAVGNADGITGGLQVYQQGDASLVLEGASILAAQTNSTDNCSATAVDIDAVYVGSGTASNITGISVQAWNVNDGGILNATSLNVLGPFNNGGGTIDTASGIIVHNVTGGSTNYAIQTGAGLVSLGDALITATHTPASATDTGVAGQFAWDASFIYICIATNTWKRVGIATW